MATIKGYGLSQDEAVKEIGRLGRKEAELFSGYLKKLPEKKWSNMSFCTEWTIKDVVEHILVAGMVMLTNGRTVMQGGSDFIGTNPADRAALKAKLSNLNRLELANKLVEDTQEIYEMLEKATPQQLNTSWRMRVGEVKFGGLGSLRLNELSLHSWDVRAVDDLTAKISRENLPMMLPGLIEFLPVLVDANTAQEISRLTYQFEVTGAVTGPAALTLDHGKTQVITDYVDKPDVALKIDADAFLRLTWGRLKLDWMINNGWIKIEGDQAAALKLTQIFQGIR